MSAADHGVQPKTAFRATSYKNVLYNVIVLTLLAINLCSVCGSCTSVSGSTTIPLPTVSDLMSSPEELSSQISSAFNAFMEALLSKREVEKVAPTDSAPYSKGNTGAPLIGLTSRSAQLDEASSLNTTPPPINPLASIVGLMPILGPSLEAAANMAPILSPHTAGTASSLSTPPQGREEPRLAGYAGDGAKDYEYYPQVRGAPILTPVMDKVCEKRGCKLLSEYDDLSLEGRPGVEVARAAGGNIGSKLQDAHDKVLGDFANPGPTRQRFNDRMYEIENKVARHWDKSLDPNGAVMNVVNGNRGGTHTVNGNPHH